MKKKFYYHQINTVSIFVSLPMPIYNVYSTCKSGKSKYSSFKEVVRPLIPFTYLFLASYLWAACSQTDVLSQDPRLYFYTIGTIFSNISVSSLEFDRNSSVIVQLIVLKFCQQLPVPTNNKPDVK